MVKADRTDKALNMLKILLRPLTTHLKAACPTAQELLQKLKNVANLLIQEDSRN